MFKLGLTMRTVKANGYDETRDALAHDWYRYIKIALPGVAWVLIPNLQTDVIDFLDQHGVNALILTGGETPGTSSKRDKTENILIEQAIDRSIPVLGVCRGMQLLIKNYGGKIVSCQKEIHVDGKHKIIWRGKDIREVNSFHEFAVSSNNFPECFEALAKTEDHKFVEAIKHRTFPIWGVMWHPEREVTPAKHDLNLFKEIFGVDY